MIGVIKNKTCFFNHRMFRTFLEIRRLWERLDHLETEDLYEVLADCRALMKQVIEITGNGCLAAWTASDFKTEILEDEK